VAALVPVVLLAISSIVPASNWVTADVDKQVQTTAAVSAVVIGDPTMVGRTETQSQWQRLG
jgi:hypothetical protein